MGVILGLTSVVSPLAGQGSSPLAGQGSSPPAGDSAKPADAQPSASELPATLRGFKLSGYAEVSYSHTTVPVGGAIVGRLYDRFANQFTLNAFKVTVDRPYTADRWDAGFRADVVVGQNAAVLQSSGLSLGSSGDVTQLYITLNAPTANGNGLQFRAGKFVTLQGVEVIETVANPNWSEGLQFVYLECFTQTGVEAGYRFNRFADAQLRVSNGWDRVVANQEHKSFMGRVGLYPGSGTSIGLLGFLGAEQSGTDAKRYGGEVLINQKVGAVTTWLQVDYGREEANPALPDSTRDATWWAAGAWVAYDLTSTLGLGLRADYLDDREGARTSAAFGLAAAPRHTLWSGTATLNVRSWPGALLRPELRYDRSNLTPFDGKRDQLTVSLSIAYLY
ncbi:MAG: outer membrane beta-barrel protein [Gemmatimonadales bacterium]